MVILQSVLLISSPYTYNKLQPKHVSLCARRRSIARISGPLVLFCSILSHSIQCRCFTLYLSLSPFCNGEGLIKPQEYLTEEVTKAKNIPQNTNAVAAFFIICSREPPASQTEITKARLCTIVSGNSDNVPPIVSSFSPLPLVWCCTQNESQ